MLVSIWNLIIDILFPFGKLLLNNAAETEPANHGRPKYESRVA